MRSTTLELPDENSRIDGTIVEVTNNMDGSVSYHYFDASYMSEYDGGYMDVPRAVDLGMPNAAERVPEADREDVMAYADEVGAEPRYDGGSDVAEDEDEQDSTNREMSVDDTSRLIDYDERETILDYEDMQGVVSEFDDIPGNASTEDMIAGLEDEDEAAVGDAIEKHATVESPQDGDSV